MKTKKEGSIATDFINRVIKRYAAEAVESEVGITSRVGNYFLSALERILTDESHRKGLEFIPSEEIKTYTQREILDMYIEDFVKTHPLSHGTRDLNRSYFLRIGVKIYNHTSGRSLFWDDLPEKQIKVWQVVKKNPNTIRVEHVGDITISGVRDYLKAYYDIELGKDYSVK
jgi:hypothetical protein